MFSLTTSIWQALGLNRDSLTLFWTKWCAFIIALAAMGGGATEIGIPAGWVKYIALAAMFISVSASQHRTSELPSGTTAAMSYRPPVGLALIPLLLLAGILASSCASTNGKLATFTSQAITANEQLHCGGQNAPQPPLCLSDAQFRAVAADLNKLSLAGLAYTQAAEAAQKAKQQAPADAFVTYVAAVSQALADIQQILGPSLSGQVVGDVRALIGKL